MGDAVSAGYRWDSGESFPRAAQVAGLCVEATADGVAFDDAGIAAAIAAASPGETVIFPVPEDFYQIAAPIVIDKPLTLAGYGAEIRQTTAGEVVFDVTSSDVAILGLKITGPQTSGSVARVVGEYLVDIHGTDGDSPISNIRVEDCEISLSGFYGIRLSYVNDFTVANNHIHECAYIGIGGVSSIGGTVSGNTVTDIHPGTETVPGLAWNAYGISFSRDQVALSSAKPRSSDIAITGNVVQNVPRWAGIDTHGGQRMAIAGNTVTNCNRAINVTSSSPLGVILLAPLDVTVQGNVIDSTVSDGSRRVGIKFYGAGDGATVGSPPELGTGTIVGNIIRGHGGDQTVSAEAAIDVTNSLGLIVSGNVIIESNPYGIRINNDNYGLSVTNNTIIDTWTDDLSQASAIRVASGYSTGLIANNTIIARSKSATHVNDEAIRVESATGHKIQIGDNYSEAATYLNDLGGNMTLPSRLNLKATLADADVTPNPVFGYLTWAPTAARTVHAPPSTNLLVGHKITFDITNMAGVPITPTWDAVFVLSAALELAA